MRGFNITATSVLDANKLTDKYPQLRDFDFSIVHRYVWTRYKEVIYDDGNGAFIRIEEPTYERVGHVAIDSLERLIELSEALDRPLFIEDGTIEIYDGYRE